MARQKESEKKLFYRNVRAGEQLDIFLVTAAASLLLLRFYLYLAGFPQVGGNGLHIAHMLWGGLLMLVCIIINLSFLGMRAQRVSAFVGGAGFGIFVDEIGKFITSDNNYFFRPAIGIIYAIFIILYLTFNFISRRQVLSSTEYQLNTLVQLEEAIANDMDPLEKQRAHDLLRRASAKSPITTQLAQLLDSVDLVPESKPALLRRVLSFLDRQYVRAWQRRNTRRLVRIFFVAEAVIFVLAIAVNNYDNLSDIYKVFNGTLTYGFTTVIGEFASSLVAAGFVIYGTLYVTTSRFRAFEYFRRATLINLFLTEFFIFLRIQFAALPGFFFNLTLLLVITYVMHQEQRTGQRHSAQ